MKSLFLFLLLLPLCAEYEVVCKFTHLQPQSEEDSLFYSGTEEKVTSCFIPSGEFSGSVKLSPIKGEIHFFNKDRSVMASASIPPNLKKGLFLFIKNQKAKEGLPPFKVLVIDFSEDKISENGSIVYNSSSHNLRFFMGEEKGYVEIGKAVRVKRPDERDAFQMSHVVFQSDLETGWVTQYETMLRFPENKHRLFLAYTNPQTNSPKLKIFRFNP